MLRKSPLLENKKLHFSTNEFDKKVFVISSLYFLFIAQGYVRMSCSLKKEKGLHNGRKTLETNQSVCRLIIKVYIF